MTLPKRSRFRRILKWMGVGMCVVIGTMFVVSIQKSSIPLGRFRTHLFSGYFAYEPLRIHMHVHSSLGTSIEYVLPVPQVFTVGGDTVVLLPLFPWFVILAVLTGVLFWREHRLRMLPGHCQKCGYDLTGNVSGKCPECGNPCEPDARST